jgi:hypothetical protein
LVHTDDSALKPTIIQNIGLRGCHSRFHSTDIAQPPSR